MGCKVEVLAYIGNHANCTTSEVNRAVRCDQNCVDWVLTRAEIDELVAEGKVEQREFRGIMYFWAK